MMSFTATLTPVPGSSAVMNVATARRLGLVPDQVPPPPRRPEAAIWVAPADGTVAIMEDDDLITRIDALVEEEHRLHSRASSNEPLAEADRQRLEELEVRLDQCWDLLRQRRARRHAGQDPDQAQARPSEVVEHYRQ